MPLNKLSSHLKMSHVLVAHHFGLRVPVIVKDLRERSIQRDKTTVQAFLKNPDEYETKTFKAGRYKMTCRDERRLF